MKVVNLINYYNHFSHIVSFDKHKVIRSKIIDIINAKREKSYDYGEGFFYQSVPLIKLKGLRNTEKRIEKLKLKDYLNKKVVLDIGTNIGAIPIMQNDLYKKCIGIDHNSDVINVATEIKNYFNMSNLEFICDNFMTYNFDTKFDVVLSLANHSTYDKGIKETGEYFLKILEILNTGGVLILESHSPLYEDPLSYLKIVESLKKNYSICDEGKYDFGNFYDKDRVYHILKKSIT